MVITTCMVTLIMLVIWKTSIWLITIFLVFFGVIEIVYASAVFYKFTDGGFLPLLLASFLMIIMGIWHYVHKQRYVFELQRKVSSDYVKDLTTNRNINRIPGMGLMFSELVQGVPPLFPHFVANIPSIHSVFVFVSIKFIPISRVAPEERFLFRQVGPREYRIFRCVVRYGYREKFEKNHEFERMLVENLKQFIRDEHYILEDDVAANTYINVEKTDQEANSDINHDDEEVFQQTSITAGSVSSCDDVSVGKSRNSSMSAAVVHDGEAAAAEEEMQYVEKAMEKGVVYLLGEIEVVAEAKSSYLKKMVVNYAYSFLRKNFRQEVQILAIPRAKLLRVGMTYEI